MRRVPEKDMYLNKHIPTPAETAMSAATVVNEPRQAVAAPKLSQQALTAGLSQAEIRRLVLDTIG
ncbi:hypothetical protein QE401_001475 [Pseudoroseomonas cervicalis]|nr:hypothetical protein [Pseudoroseomonas cervicalis]